jgi:myo-inositol-1(or 4)-monophosphatase
VVIACTKDGVTHTAVIHDPCNDETFYGERGGGAFLNGRPIRTSSSQSLGDGSLGVGFAGRRRDSNVPALIADLIGLGGVFFRNASGALMLAYVASGRLIGYVEQHMNSWDCIAGLLLIEEAGGRIVAPDPESVVASGTPIIAGGVGVFEEIRALHQRHFGG